MHTEQTHIHVHQWAVGGRSKLYPGKYQYKLIVDGSWTYSADHPTATDGSNINNVLEVIPKMMDPETVQKQVAHVCLATSVICFDPGLGLQQMVADPLPAQPCCWYAATDC
jgi:hypothetical protein